MVIKIVFFNKYDRVYWFEMTICDFECLLWDVLPRHELIVNSKLCDRYYIIQFWNRCAINKPIHEVMYMSQFLNKMTVEGYDFSQYNMRCECEFNVKTSLKRKNGDGFTSRDVRLANASECTTT